MEYDQPFKDLLEVFLPEFVALFFPEEAAQIAWDEIEFIRNELYTELVQGNRRTLDVLAKVRSRRGEPELLLVHVEVEADPQREFPHRFCDYYTTLRLRRRLPILPIAVYLRPGYGGITMGRYEETVFGTRVLLFEYHVVALPDIPRSRLPAANPVTHALAPLLAERPTDPVDLVLESLRGIARTGRDPARQELLASFLSHVVDLNEAQITELDRRLEYTDSQEVARLTTHFHERGRAEGRVEGRVEEAEHLLSRLLEARFGVAPGYLDARLGAQRDRARLEDLAIRAATAASLEEFEQHLPKPDAR